MDNSLKNRLLESESSATSHHHHGESGVSREFQDLTQADAEDVEIGKNRAENRHAILRDSRDDQVPFREDGVLVFEEVEKSKEDGKGSPCWMWCGCTLVSVLCIYLVLLFAVLPSVSQSVLDESTLVLVTMHMKNASNDRIVLNATNELHDVGPMSATLEASVVELHWDDYLLAEMEMPELDIVGGDVLQFNMETTLIVKNASAFTLATARVLQGYPAKWYIRGDATLRLKNIFGFGRKLHLKMDKEMDIPATLLEDVRGYGGTVVEGSGTENSLQLKARTSMFSSSVLEMHHLGLFVFDLYVPVNRTTGDIVREQGSAMLGDETDHILVGEVSVEDFDIRRGLNDVPTGGLVLKTKENEKVLSQFLSAYLEGRDQIAIFKGPTKSPAIYLDNVVEQLIVFTGSTDNHAVEVSALDKETTFVGFSPKLPDGSRPTYRGPSIIVHNTLDATVVQRNVSSFVYLAEPLEYKFHHMALGTHHCKRSDMLGLLETKPGMYKDDVNKEPIITFTPREKKTTFMPGGPIPGQSDPSKPCRVGTTDIADGADCCFVTVNIAAACRAKSRQHKSFDTRLHTKFVMEIQDFRVFLDVHQDSIATTFTEDVTGGFLQDMFISCANFDISS